MQYTDGTQELEYEDVAAVRFPKQRFNKPVKFAIFFYGFPDEIEEPAIGEEQKDPGLAVTGLSTDVTFPGLSPDIPVEIRRSVARLHLNLGHPTSQELLRMLAYQGTAPTAVVTAVRALQCATCQRLKKPQRPRPAATTSSVWRRGPD